MTNPAAAAAPTASTHGVTGSRRGAAAGLAQIDVAAAAELAETWTPWQTVAWAVARFGRRVCVASSMTDAVVIHLASSVAPGIDIVFGDTGMHFPETLETAALVERTYPIRLRRAVSPAEAPSPLDGVEVCCARRKVAPFRAALERYDAWLTGGRRCETPQRAAMRVVEFDDAGRIRINPLAAWEDDDVAAYIDRHQVVVNPLVGRGYPSIGCAPCTSPVRPGEDPRAGRWRGTPRTECGLLTGRASPPAAATAASTRP